MLNKQLDYIRNITDFEPEIVLVLGSGLGDLGNEVDAHCIINYSDIPDFPVSTAPSHNGRLIFTEFSGKKVAIMQGRVHLYEGYTPAQTVNPLRLLRKMGAKTLFLTNAAGGINSSFRPGDLMIINDHISSFVDSPLIGPNDDTLGARFPDMSEVYSKRLGKIISDTADSLDIHIKNGVYIQFKGPNFETPAEIQMAKILGADAVGMSSAIEAQAAKHCGYEVCAISVISNLACGISKTPITSEEVEETAKQIAPKFKKLILKSIKNFQ